MNRVIMILITLYNVCAVPSGYSVPWGGGFSTVGDIMSTVGGYLDYRGGYHDKCGGYLEYHGGYLEYHGGCSVPWGIS